MSGIPAKMVDMLTTSETVEIGLANGHIICGQFVEFDIQENAIVLRTPAEFIFVPLVGEHNASYIKVALPQKNESEVGQGHGLSKSALETITERFRHRTTFSMTSAAVDEDGE